MIDLAKLRREGFPASPHCARSPGDACRECVFDMVDGGAGDEITMRRNEQALADIELIPKISAGAPKRDQSIELFGERLRSPVVIGPTGLAGLLCRTPTRRRARRGAVRDDLLGQPRIDRDRRRDRRRDRAGRSMQVFLYKDRGLTADSPPRCGLGITRV